MKSIKRFIGVVAVALLITVGVQPAVADSLDPSSPEAVRSGLTIDQLRNAKPVPSVSGGGKGPQLQSAAASYTVTCTVHSDNPHFSTGANGMIFKARVSCTGTGSYPSSVQVRVRGGLFFDYAASPGDTSNINFVQTASSDRTDWLNVNGSTYTFYTPEVGWPGSRGMGFWQGTTTIQLITPAGSVGSHSSQIIWQDAR